MASKLNSGEGRHYKGDFLPDLCTVQAVFSLILVGELLTFAFVVIDYGIYPFDWLLFGSVSFLVQWVILASAALLCPLRKWLKSQRGEIAGSVSYSIVLAVTGVFTIMGQWLTTGLFFTEPLVIVENLIIAAIFAGVVLRYFYLQQQLQNREKIELRSRVQALQSRIRPHFLFNSMNSIASLIDIDPKAAEKMVVNLSQLFRASLKEVSLVTLDEEISLCKQFVSIEQTRLGDRLRVHWDIAIEGQQAHIPSLLLQPLIENAIYHGVQALPEGGQVNIKVQVDNGRVFIRVANPIPGDDQKNIDKLSNGMALENIGHRLQAHFGDKSRLSFSKDNNEFVVDLSYPVIKSIENEG